ncbi:MAG TPA: hypothetical protein VNS63_28070 [Blastocatellia bacterium]|nr:hypothetical protein [Blastocatellia bacterium]
MSTRSGEYLRPVRQQRPSFVSLTLVAAIDRAHTRIYDVIGLRKRAGDQPAHAMDTDGHLFEGSDRDSADKMERLFGTSSPRDEKETPRSQPRIA